MLEAFGARGTYYTATSLMNGSSENISELTISRRSQGHGHEFGNHTFSHSSGRSLSAGAFRDDVEKGRQALEKLVGKSVSNFVTRTDTLLLGPTRSWPTT